jgi:hypothetical protein
METSTKQPSSIDQASDPVVREIRKYDKVCLSRVDFERGWQVVRSLNRNRRTSARVVDCGLSLLPDDIRMNHNPLDVMAGASFSRS